MGKTKRLKPLALAGILAVGAAAAVFLTRRAGGPPPMAAVGAPAPDFTLSDLGGTPVTLSKLKGRPVLLNFWATWCTSCEQELPDLKALHAKLKPEGLAILAPSIDLDGKKAVFPFVARFDLTFPVLFADPRTADAYGVRALPTSWLIAPDGTAVKRYVGPLSFKEVENDILSLIRRPS